LSERKEREGRYAFPSGKAGAREPEEAVLQVVARRVLTPDFVSDLIQHFLGIVLFQGPLPQFDNRGFRMHNIVIIRPERQPDRPLRSRML
jgi:hypothetical protein